MIEELHPTLGNLIGRIDYVSSRGVLITNFRLIKAGAMHRANGGYLLLDVRSLLTEPFSWTALKRTIRQGEIKIEDVTRFLGLTSTVSLEPDPIPLNVKVVLFGDRLLYFLLVAFDPEIGQHFKVLADFENDMDRTPAERGTACTHDCVDRAARWLEAVRSRSGRSRARTCRASCRARRQAHAAGGAASRRLDARRISGQARPSAASCRVPTSTGRLTSGSGAHRGSATEFKNQSCKKVALIDTTGSSVGQINGLSVSELGGFSFGRPTRITCQVRPGSGKVVDIEREVELGGPIHSKGVLILSGFLAGRYALDVPMSLYASLVFEQSYGGVEGDSASSAELYALMSALADVPLRQELAVTGSVNQHGEIQAIGGVNEKIEGFFDICRARA